MSKNIKLDNTIYSGVVDVQLPTENGGTATFKDVDEIGTDTPTYDTPIISVTTGGLITAKANGKSATHQLSASDDSDFVAGNIKEGKNIFGILGTLSTSDSSSGGITPTGSQTFTTNGTYDVTNIAQAIVNVAEGGSIENIEMGTVVLTDEDVTNKKFSFELQNPADMVLVYPTFSLSKTSTVRKTIFLMFNQAMVKFLGSSEQVSGLSNQVYGVGAHTTANTLLAASSYAKGAENTNGIFDNTVNVDLGSATHVLVAGTYKFVAFRGIVQ